MKIKVSIDNPYLSEGLYELEAQKVLKRGTRPDTGHHWG